jgi:hypothetical protein
LDEAACHSPSNETTATGDEYTGHAGGKRESGKQGGGGGTVNGFWFQHKPDHELRKKENRKKPKNQLEMLQNDFPKQTVCIL